MFKYLPRIGLITGSLIFCVVLWRMDWPVFIKALLAVDGILLFLCAILLGVGVASRALRWSIIADSGISNYYAFWCSTLVGYLSNMLYPGRAGEVIRIVAVTKLTDVSPGRAAGSALTDRVMDGMTLGLLLTGISFYAQLPEYWRYLAMTMSVGAGIAAAALIIFICVDEAQLPEWQIIKRLRPFLMQLISGLKGLRNPRVSMAVLLVHGVAFGLDFLTYYVLLCSFGWRLPFEAAVILKVLMTAASSLPSTPGYLGVYQIAAIAGLSLYSIDESQAVAFSILWQVIQLFVFAVQMGGVIVRRQYLLKSVDETCG